MMVPLSRLFRECGLSESPELRGRGVASKGPTYAPRRAGHPAGCVDGLFDLP